MPAEKTPRTEVYQLDLDGKAYQAAMALNKVINEAYAKNPTSLDRKTLFAELQAQHPDLLQATGLLSPSTQVMTYNDGQPRTHLTYATIYPSYKSADDKKPDLYMYITAGYKGDHFTPDGATKLDEKQAERVGMLLFAGGWLETAPIFRLPDVGIATPADFDVKVHNSFDRSLKENRTTATFIAEGRSLELIEDFRQRKGQQTDACAAVREWLTEIVLSSYKTTDLSATQGEIYVNVGYSAEASSGKKTGFSLSVRKTGNLSLMDGGQPLELSSNAHFLVKEKGGGEYWVTPNKKTKEGKALKQLFDAVPLAPGLADYAELRGNFPIQQDGTDKLLGINGVVPRLHSLMGKTILVYNRDIDTKTYDAATDGQSLVIPAFCPPDARPLDTALFLWLSKDDEDRNVGISPPPMPDALKKPFAELFGETAEAPARPATLPASRKPPALKS